jgi:hypothetical protein
MKLGAHDAPTNDSKNKKFFTPIPLGYPKVWLVLCVTPELHKRTQMAPTLAPALPAAAERPWQVDIKVAGKSLRLGQ